MDTCDNSCEPMDIDLSMNSVSSLDVSTAAFPLPITDPPKKRSYVSPKKREATPDNLHPGTGKAKVEWNIKKFHLKHEPNENRKPFLRVKFIIALVVLCFSIIGYCATNISCMNKLQLDMIEQELTTKLHGQKFALDQVIETLNVETSSKILFLYGGTGVGKTYTVSLILRDSWNYSNIYHFTMPSFRDTFTTNLLSGLILCESTVMVVDNLSQNDMEVSRLIKQVVEKSENLSRLLTIFLIYNCDTVSTGFVKKCDSSFLHKLKDSYSDIKALKAFVKFEMLTEDVLKKCIQDEIGDRKLSEADMDGILKNFDVFSDGCKGVHTKINFLNVTL